ncbi:NitT/TauT family transport system permease protein [Nitrobacteraceae bacterium AZCC 2161]
MGSTPYLATFQASWRPAATGIVLVALLEVAKRIHLLPIFVPAPSEVMWEIWKTPRLVTDNLVPTAWKAAAGYGLSASIAIVAASIAVSLRALYGPIYNISVIINSVPIIATAPLLALWLGTGTQVQIAIAALASQFPMLVGTIQGLQAADSRQRELMHVLYASRSQTLRYLLIPSALPYLFAGLKIAAPAAVLGAITAEWAGADRGVGAMMLYALFSYDTPKVWLSVALTCLLAGAGFGIWAAIERVAVYWRHDVELAD